ncbi:hypothetical protein [Amaricoccus sp.]|uniref:hypothetical protein n=1 Tax=Amaricoccus sp. TaxID=1872485 RepID=UPI001B48739F|nr:hypothetical protein [Amaricoccus sp.]MBP7002206.1 hypothetical protein [Amaricoccus sp.]
MTEAAGYSGRPLVAKLGCKPGMRALLLAAPAGPLAGLAAFPFAETCMAGTAETAPPGPFDLVIAFEREAALLATALPALRARLAPAGALWIAWPKKAAKVPTTLTEDVIRSLALAGGLVDVKVCAVDAVWSGLKLVIPRALRPAGSR